MPDGSASAGLFALVVLAALAFSYINGFHDTANAIATSVSTRVLTPRQAVLLSGVLNFAGAMLSTGVAATVGKGIVEPRAVSSEILLAALLAAIAWNLVTWAYGIPSSSSHALIGGVIGAALAAKGPAVLEPSAWRQVILPLVVSPPVGLVGGFLAMTALYWLLRGWSPIRVNGWFSRLQIVSAAWMSLTHGLNDAQKSMGIIGIALVSAGVLPSFAVPLWVKVLAAATMALGTAAGGWRIIRTLGMRMIRLQPVHGFAAEVAAAAVITLASALRMPVSTTHVIASSVMGVGTARNWRLVRWQIASEILVAMVVTIPVTAAIAALVYAVMARL
ncbi:MAG: inorganic phosphate transporter [Clostridia bacterium]|nr:inorganic phosphate transporter [Clostridia bacterium]